MTVKWRLASVLILLSVGAAPVRAAGDAPKCDNTAIAEAELERKVAPLLTLQPVQQWMKRMPRDIHTALIPSEAEVELDGKCYREVTLYESHPDRLHRWHSFMIGKRDVLIENLDGDWVPLEAAQW